MTRVSDNNESNQFLEKGDFAEIVFTLLGEYCWNIC